MTSYPVGNKTSFCRKHAFQVSMERYQEVMVAVSESDIKICLKRPLRRNHDEVISVLQLNLFISETMHRRQNVIVERYQEVEVTLSESIMKNRRKRTLAKKSR